MANIVTHHETNNTALSSVIEVKLETTIIHSHSGQTTVALPLIAGFISKNAEIEIEKKSYFNINSCEFYV